MTSGPTLDWERAMGRLSARQQAKVSAAYLSLEDGALTAEEFTRVVVNVVQVGNARGRILGQAIARALIEAETQAAEITSMRRTPGIVRPEEDRLTKAVATILASEHETLMQLQRLADNEPKQAAADGAADVIRGSKKVSGWVREVESEACPLCLWWGRAGRVWQPDHPMPRHTGCVCSPKPVTTTTGNYQTEKQAKSAAERAAERSRSNDE